MPRSKNLTLSLELPRALVDRLERMAADQHRGFTDQLVYSALRGLDFEEDAIRQAIARREAQIRRENEARRPAPASGPAAVYGPPVSLSLGDRRTEAENPRRRLPVSPF